MLTAGSRRPVGLLLAATALAMVAGRASPAAACAMADQYRLLPLGMSDGKVVALELDQYRDQKSIDSPIIWRVTPRLVFLDLAGGETEIERYPEVIVTSREYVKEITPVVARALVDAAGLPGFREARAVSMARCGYVADCGRHQVTQKGRVVTKLGQKTELRSPIWLPQGFLGHRNAMAMLDAEGDKLTTATVAKRRPDLLAGWLLGSVRIYRVGSVRLVAYHLGNGDTRFSTSHPPEETDLDVVAGGLIYDEELPHHGYSFDLVHRID